jgi:hypothetical protein
MQSHHLAAVFLATALWAIFGAAVALWNPPDRSGVQLAAKGSMAAYRPAPARAAAHAHAEAPR